MHNCQRLSLKLNDVKLYDFTVQYLKKALDSQTVPVKTTFLVLSPALERRQEVPLPDKNACFYERMANKENTLSVTLLIDYLWNLISDSVENALIARFIGNYFFFV